jgi:hypothetical protein
LKKDYNYFKALFKTENSRSDMPLRNQAQDFPLKHPQKNEAANFSKAGREAPKRTFDQFSGVFVESEEAAKR